MSGRYRVASMALGVLALLTFTGAYLGWGLPSDASTRARSVREGSLRSRTFIGGGPRYGK